MKRRGAGRPSRAELEAREAALTERENAAADAARRAEIHDCAQAISGLVTWPFAVAGARDPVWVLKDEETERLSEAIAAVAVKYGVLSGRWKEEIVLLVTVAGIVGPRVAAMKANKAAPPKAADAVPLP